MQEEALVISRETMNGACLPPTSKWYGRCVSHSLVVARFLSAAGSCKPAVRPPPVESASDEERRLETAVPSSVLDGGQGARGDGEGEASPDDDEWERDGTDGLLCDIPAAPWSPGGGPATGSGDGPRRGLKMRGEAEDDGSRRRSAWRVFGRVGFRTVSP
ncbi:hypothetical protein THAOC_03045 [Thalassiosira oceanica]|uniref:Uncharacterized protein n=1 Tax=Thalassiosira oceanica TaxID=159749 RepID=K0TCV9_THAOC|nr:hypothetical protein THAOC_03045 [Thalassiosira oceanica]|eukprot:EJK75240.1 hypothetical protein THAOC_03045 [Thalassiosira oceanica]